MASFGERLRHAWNIFKDQGEEDTKYEYVATYYRPYRRESYSMSDKSTLNAIYNRIALDISEMNFYHVIVDKNNVLKEIVPDGLNDCLSVEANIDQSNRELIQDIVLSMFEDGVVAVVPVTTRLNPNNTGSYDILELRTGKIVQWGPHHVKVDIYNDNTGRHEKVDVNKRNAAIIPNPFYSVMNEPNTVYQRLVRKINLLDSIDEQSGSGRLDLIIQLPYAIKTEARRKQADRRKKDIEEQLYESKYGIAYTDATEKITQLNRPVDNQLVEQIKTLTDQLYSLLGVCEEIINNTADEKTQLNYRNNILVPICDWIAINMTRKFLTKTARTQGHKITYYFEYFKSVPASQIGSVADSLGRNEILSPNEIRGMIGYRPSDDPKADELRNRNISQPAEEANKGNTEKNDNDEE